MASASTPQPPVAHPRQMPPRPALRPILPKPPAIAPMDRTAASTVASTSASSTTTTTTTATTTTTTTTAAAKGPAQSSLSHLGSRVIGSVASSIFAGSTTITLPPRPSASRSKAKKRTSPDRVIAISSDTNKMQDTSASNAAALKKRRRAKLPTLSASVPGIASVALGSLKPVSSTVSTPSSDSTSTHASSVASPVPDPVSGPAASVASPPSSSAPSAAVAASTATPATPLRHTGSRPGIAIPHTTPQSESAGFSSGFDLNILSPDAFSLPAASSDIWWPRLDDSSSIGLYDSDINISSSASSTLASASAAARRNLDRASSTSSLSSSLSSSTYFSDSTISTAVSSIVIDEEPEFDSELGKRAESEISDMIHRLITGDVKRDAVEEDDDEMLFAAPTDTSSVRQSRAGSEGARPRAQKRDPLRQLFSISSSISSKSQPKQSESTATQIASPEQGPAGMAFGRAASEPASITIPAEKNSFEDESEKDFILNRALLVKKGLGFAKTTKHHAPYRFSSSTTDVITYTDNAAEIAISGVINEDLFAEDDDDEMISSTTSHESGSIDIDVDVDGTSDVLFGGLDDLGLVDDEQDPFTFLDVVGGATGNEVVESTVGW
ncbi:hypothetical protein V1520DRAFT_340806 [Lipomyces starkeyi]|uniref:Uncharacterized protein n=1 Tax=Lipomyces starkeyi NRRL Y-11557 TaxID=675824 RepID=A0A1E3Q4Y6_LIPST|nr:hypothetical protein LIPSTDRAFT_64020 [Lipomyces starkeyi NRRL Y-11557]